MPWNFNPQPQTRKEFVKNEKRIKDLVDKCGGDKAKEIALSKNMANKIETPEKAYNRGHVARELGFEHIFEVFYNRAFELGSVTLAEHRDHEIEKIMSDVDVLEVPKLTLCEDLEKYDYTQFKELKCDEVPDFLIKQVTEVMLITLQKDYDDFKNSTLFNEEESDEYERLLKRLNFKKVKQIVNDDEAWFGETKNDKFDKIYHFQMDSDKFHYATEINLSGDGYQYFRVD